MGKLINFECHTEPETTLFQQEIDVLVEVIGEVMRGFSEQPNKGTCIIDGQKYGEEARCLVRFNLPEGIYRRQFFRIYEKTSDRMAEEAINNALSYPDNSRYTKTCDREDSQKMQSGIYQDGELKVLNLNTTAVPLPI